MCLPLSEGWNFSSVGSFCTGIPPRNLRSFPLAGDLANQRARFEEANQTFFLVRSVGSPRWLALGELF